MKMKKIITAILTMTLLLTTATALAACGGEAKTPDVNTIMTAIRKDIEFPEMADINKENFNGYYETSVDTIDQMSYIIAGGGATTDEVLILKMKDGTDMADIKTKMEKRLKMQTDLFSTYNPPEMPKLESAVIEINGNYAFFAITNDNAKAKKIFSESF